MDFDENEETRSAIETTEIPERTDIDKLDKIGLAKSLGLENFKEIDKYDEQLQRIINWAKTQGAKDQIDVLGLVKGLTTRLGDRSIRNLSTYVYLESQRLALEAKIRRLEK